MRLYARGRHRLPAPAPQRQPAPLPLGAAVFWAAFTVTLFALAAYADLTNLLV